MKKPGKNLSRSLCTYCENPILCDWLKSRPTPECIPYWEEQGYIIKQAKVHTRGGSSQLADVYLVQSCPLYKEGI